MLLRFILGRSDRARDPARRADAGRVVGVGLRGARPGPVPLGPLAADPADWKPGPGGDRVADGKAGHVLRACVLEGLFRWRENKGV